MVRINRQRGMDYKIIQIAFKLMETENNKEGQPQTDAFGEPISTNQPEPEKKEGEEGEKKPEDGKGDEIDKHPTVVALRTQITQLEKDKGEYGKNLSEQGKALKNLQKQLVALQKGGKTAGEEGEVLFKEIKTSKDLTEKEKEDMTETEIKLFDQNAELKASMNKLFTALNDKKGKETEATEGDEDEGKDDDGTVEGVEKVDDLGKEARSVASEIAGGDVALANNIIGKFNMFAGNDKLDKAQLKERMLEAAKLVPDYKPPKEQQHHQKGSAAGGTKGDDPFGVNKIVEGVGKKNDGGYKL